MPAEADKAGHKKKGGFWQMGLALGLLIVFSVTMITVVYESLQ